MSMLDKHRLPASLLVAVLSGCRTEVEQVHEGAREVIQRSGVEEIWGARRLQMPAR